MTGLTLEKITLIVVLGLVLGTFPVVGCPTILCGLAALALRVNWPALQVVNQVTTPMQIVLLVPLSRAGSWIFGSHTSLAGTIMNAVAGWCCFCLPAGVLLYLGTLMVLRVRRGCIAGAVRG